MRRIKKARLATGVSLANVGAAIRNLPTKKLQPTTKNPVKDIPLPHPVSLAEINELLAARGHKISEALHKEEQAIAKILDDTAHQISEVQRSFRKQ